MLGKRGGGVERSVVYEREAWLSGVTTCGVHVYACVHVCGAVWLEGTSSASEGEARHGHSPNRVKPKPQTVKNSTVTPMEPYAERSLYRPAPSNHARCCTRTRIPCVNVWATLPTTHPPTASPHRRAPQQRLHVTKSSTVT